MDTLGTLLVSLTMFNSVHLIHVNFLGRAGGAQESFFFLANSKGTLYESKNLPSKHIFKGLE